MQINEWDERYRSGQRRQEDWDAPPNPLLVDTASKIPAGDALDLACGSGRNSIWLAQHGWKVTAVDGAASAIQLLQRRALQIGISLEAKVADLESGTFEGVHFEIGESCWDLIAMCFYLQRSLFEPAIRGLRPGGIVLAIVHLNEAGEEPGPHRVSSGELKGYFRGCEILHYYEGQPNDAAHKRSVAEIVARRPLGRVV